MRTPMILSLLAALFIASACQRDDETGTGENTEMTDPGSATAPPATLFQDTSAYQPVSPQPENKGMQPVTNVTQQATTPVKQEALNPPHGQPGHRCDIPVGAPLSSAPKVQKTAPVSAEPPANKTSLIYSTPDNMPNVVVPDPASVETKPGMNPPHGQPGHRCDIKVGDPLPTQ